MKDISSHKSSIQKRLLFRLSVIFDIQDIPKTPERIEISIANFKEYLIGCAICHKILSLIS